MVSKEETKEAVEQFFHALVRRVSPNTVDRLISGLSDPLASQLREQQQLFQRHAPKNRANDEDDPLIDREVFIGPMVQKMDTVPGYDPHLGGMDDVAAYLDNDARRRLEAIFHELRNQLPDNDYQRMVDELPPEIANWATHPQPIGKHE